MSQDVIKVELKCTISMMFQTCYYCKHAHT